MLLHAFGQSPRSFTVSFERAGGFGLPFSRRLVELEEVIPRSDTRRFIFYRQTELSVRIATFAMLMVVLIATQADASCEEVWDPPIADRPEITCASFSEKLIFGLKGATKAEVRKAMNAQGIERKEGGQPILHYASPQENLGGDVYFAFGPNGRVARIVGFAQSNEGDKFGPRMDFIWNPDPALAGKPDGNGGLWTGGCSDLPGHAWPACNRRH
jgi:hypothetical protein